MEPTEPQAPRAPDDAAFPAHWEADVVLRDGSTAHLRPVGPHDADRLVAFYGRVSAESKYLRFFSPYPRLSDRDVRRFTHHDWVDRVGLGLFVGGDMVAIVRYDRIGPDGRAVRTGPRGRSSTAEVAFLVQDDQQGRGVASVLLEHIAAVARERGIRRFIADVLPANRRMMHVFTEAGYTQQSAFEDGVVRLTLDLQPTDSSTAVMLAREHRAEARSTARLLNPRSVAVIGAGRREGTVGNTLLRDLAASGFTGPVYAVNPAAGNTPVEGVPAYPTVADIPGEVDLAIVAVPAPEVQRVVEDCGRHGVHGLVVVSSGFAETGDPEGRERQRRLVRTARSHGMRVIGPNCLGLLNTDPAVSVNASLAPRMPRRGRVGMFAQSGALGIAILESTVDRGIGLSTFVSAGNRADVSGNDLLQYWEDDPATDVVLLHLESLGNPRKFTRLARRVSRRKPVVVVKSLRHAGGVPRGHGTRALTLPDHAVDSLFRQAGVIRVPTVAEMFDVAQLLAYQPLPAGDRVAIVGNSDSLGLLTQDACTSASLEPLRPVDLTTAATAEDFRTALGRVIASPDADAVVAVFIPPLSTHGDEVAGVLGEMADRAAEAGKPLLATYLAHEGLPDQLRRLDADGVPARGSVPSYPAPENAVRALAEVVRYAAWRRRPVGGIVAFADTDAEAARGLVRARLGGADAAGLSPAEAGELLGCYGIRPLPAVRVDSEDAAVDAAALLGYPVVLKTIAEHLRHRVDLDGVRLDLGTEVGLRRAFRRMAARLGGPDQARLVVQRMAPRGVATTVGVTYDESFGAMLHFGLAGPASELLGDVAHRAVPATDKDVADLVRDIRAAPVLFGYRGAPPVDVAALEELLLRLSALADDLPQVTSVVLDPVVVTEEGLSVLDARVRLSRPPARTDLGPRSMRKPL
ncbi:bifunctional GNAT family N-acetyltransferase/acetate--CoA ligase family protein [Yinghuangia sp. ASG 101]|uniref:bifunctional acetate--CoA ligase family protein/GNAT family N-acetyltransferase n=1 Tax=Yinghuangia sp. ASG 101 TaxID=2896848 RepID=UPI001E65A45C|nr:bifunctional GNAT family N-acetyltransferase/acetate--CoA ligase family protein [Yinghuangia sp. ASG 101]UGQ13872.1 bifunctional GNAT family N-acetyltransferase/acetate--CoA ligase family protein [Yinghuangia sp. ASG 101]